MYIIKWFSYAYTSVDFCCRKAMMVSSYLIYFLEVHCVVFPLDYGVWHANEEFHRKIIHHDHKDNALQLMQLRQSIKMDQDNLKYKILIKL